MLLGSMVLLGSIMLHDRLVSMVALVGVAVANDETEKPTRRCLESRKIGSRQWPDSIGAITEEGIH